MKVLNVRMAGPRGHEWTCCGDVDLGGWERVDSGFAEVVAVLAGGLLLRDSLPLSVTRRR